MISTQKIVRELLLSENSPLKQPACVLLVDDNEDLCEVVSEMLKSSGLEVLSATSGQAALDIIRRHPGFIDILVTDVHMPRLSGIELARLATVIRPEMRVLFVSADLSGALSSGQLDPNASALCKPFDSKILLHELRKALDC